MLGLHEHSLSYGQAAVARGTVSLNIMSQREDGFRVNSKAKGSTNAARRAGFNSREGAMFRKPFTTLFQASWLSVEAFHSHP